MLIRKVIVSFLFIFLAPYAIAEPTPFTGVWAIKWCDKNPNHECGRFNLYLVQTGKRICGDHFSMTINAGRLNEGMPKSIIGTVSGNTATVSITSGRDNSVYRAKAKLSGGKLDWQLMEKIKDGEGDEPLINDKARLVKMTDADANRELDRVISECSE